MELSHPFQICGVRQIFRIEVSFPSPTQVKKGALTDLGMRYPNTPRPSQPTGRYSGSGINTNKPQLLFRLQLLT